MAVIAEEAAPAAQLPKTANVRGRRRDPPQPGPVVFPIWPERGLHDGTGGRVQQKPQRLHLRGREDGAVRRRVGEEAPSKAGTAGTRSDDTWGKVQVDVKEVPYCFLQ